MTIFGIGKKIGVKIFLSLILIISIDIWFDVKFQYSKNYEGLGYILIIVGLFLSFKEAFRVTKAFKEKKLLTDGLFKITKNPVYLSHIIFTIPGLSLVLNNYLVLILTPLMIILLKKFIFEEEEYLYLTFGNEYENYRKSVFIKFI